MSDKVDVSVDDGKPIGNLIHQAVIVVNMFDGNKVVFRSVGMGNGDEAEELADAVASALKTTFDLACRIGEQEDGESK